MLRYSLLFQRLCNKMKKQALNANKYNQNRFYESPLLTRYANRYKTAYADKSGFGNAFCLQWFFRYYGLDKDIFHHILYHSAVKNDLAFLQINTSVTKILYILAVTDIYYRYILIYHFGYFILAIIKQKALNFTRISN